MWSVCQYLSNAVEISAFAQKVLSLSLPRYMVFTGDLNGWLGIQVMECSRHDDGL